MEFNYVVNEYQTPIEALNLQQQPEEIQEQFIDFITNVPFIQNLISPDRKRAKDLPKDSKGRIIVDITEPHILEDMDYFRPSAKHFQQYGCYTKLRPNSNPNSEFGRWIIEEARRCREGYVRETDGEWVTGDYYYFLNYAPMSLVKKDDKNSKKGKRVIDFPSVWEGHYLKFHAVQQARDQGHHYAELASRSKGKSFCAASMLSKRFILGESADVNKKVTSYITADDKKYLVNGDQTLDKFQFNIDWAAQYMEWPSKRLINSLSNMQWMMGYKDVDSGTNQGTLNSVVGVTSKDDPAKLRGSRGVLYVLEEFGTFPALLDLVNNLRPSVEEGEDVFGLIMMFGTAGDKDSDFTSAQEIIYNPKGYNVIAFKNVYDKVGQGRQTIGYFFPGYLNLAGCYDENGNSDVIKAIFQILKDRYFVKYNSTKVNTITKRIAEIPITPQEAMLKTKGNMFPITQLTQRLNEIDNDPNFYADTYVGTLIQDSAGVVTFQPTYDTPIRDYPIKDNKDVGAIEIYQMPQTDSSGKPMYNRYIVGHDPVDADSAESQSLTSTLVLDTFTDQIVAEYTGRQPFADDNFEIVRRLCLFYNAKCLYEQNKKGLFAYFQKMSSLSLLKDTPEYLKDIDVIKSIGYGNQSKGVNASTPVNNYANDRIRDWLLKPINVDVIDDHNELVVQTIPNLFTIKNRALLKELIAFNPDINVDRVRALGMLMLYREELLIRGKGTISKEIQPQYKEDDYFTKNYDNKFKHLS